MGDSYVECLVSRDRNTMHYVLRIVMYVLAGVCLLLAIMGIAIALIGAIAFAVIGTFVCPNPDLEFEYLLIGRDLSIDKIIAKSKRKTVDNLDLNKMEFMCPINSHELDSYKNKKTPMKDYSSCKADAKVYAIAYHDEKGDSLVCIEPNAEFIAAIKTIMPRKVIEY